MRQSMIGLGMMTICGGLLLTGCGSNSQNSTSTEASSTGEVSANQEYSIHVVQEMPSIDLSLNTDVIGAVALNNVYEGLYRSGKEHIPELAGASDVTVSEDGLIYNFKLREDAIWSDEVSVTAKDYVYGWQRTVAPETGSEQTYLFEPIKNAKAIIKGEMEPSELGIRAINDYELEIELAEASPFFDYALATATFMPQRQDIIEKAGDNYASSSETLVYNGPFVLTEFDGPGTDTEWAFEKNETYWDSDVVQLERINFSVIKEASTSLNMYESGEVEDILLTGEMAQQKLEDPDFISEKLGGTYFLQMNQAKDDSPLKNENLRKAISYALDRDILVNQILANGSEASTGLMPNGIAFSPTGTDIADELENKLSYDVEKAQEYLEKAKKELGEENIDIELMASDNDSIKKIIEFIQGSLEENLPGVNISISSVPFSVRLQRASSGDFDMVYGGWVINYPDPSGFLELFESNKSSNDGKYSSQKYDDLLAESRANALDPEARWQNLVDAEAVLLDEMGTVPIIQDTEARLRTPYIKDVVAHPTGPQYDYKWAYKVD